MSRIGKKIILIPDGVTVSINDRDILVKGPKGELKLILHLRVNAKMQDNKIFVERAGNDKLANSLHGLTRCLIFNMIEGVTKGYEKKLQIIGVGYKAVAQNNKLVLTVGYSHTVEIEAPSGINLQVQKNIIIVSGIDKQLVGQIAADIRSVKKPEPYKGKGIKYIDELIRRKAGKTAKASTGTGA